MPANEALIVVDVQNLFVDVVGEPVLAAVNDRIETAGRHGRPIYYTRDYAPVEGPPDDPRFDLHPKLDVRGTVVTKGPGRKGGFSGFVHTPVPGADEGPGTGGLSRLGALLARDGVEAVTVVGIAADVCVAATARDAAGLGYRVTVPLSATAFVGAHPSGADAAVAELRAAGITVTE